MDFIRPPIFIPLLITSRCQVGIPNSFAPAVGGVTRYAEGIVHGRITAFQVCVFMLAYTNITCGVYQ